MEASSISQGDIDHRGIIHDYWLGFWRDSGSYVGVRWTNRPEGCGIIYDGYPLYARYHSFVPILLWDSAIASSGRD